MIHPRKINIEPQNDGLEDDFPSRGIFSDSMLIFRGVYVIINVSSPRIISLNVEGVMKKVV